MNTPVEPESDQLTGGEDVEGESSTRAHLPEKPPDDRRRDTVDQVSTEARLAETEKRHAEVHGAKLEKRCSKEKHRWNSNPQGSLHRNSTIQHPLSQGESEMPGARSLTRSVRIMTANPSSPS